MCIRDRANSGNWTQIDSAEANTQSYTDMGAAGNADTNSYFYDIRACNSRGCSPANPNPVVVPFAPTGLAASIVGTKVHLAWTGTSGNESNFQVFRRNGTCTSTNPITGIATLAANTKSYDDGSAVSQETYSYMARAINITAGLPSSVGYSKWSNCVAAKAP